MPNSSATKSSNPELQDLREKSELDILRIIAISQEMELKLKMLNSLSLKQLKIQDSEIYSALIQDAIDLQKILS